MTEIRYRKKLIEVTLPLDAINEGSKPETENPFLKGHPRGVHNWWARTPLSVCRAVLFAQLVDDPGEGLDGEEADAAREPLVNLVRKLGTWKATTESLVVEEARSVLIRQFDGKLPAFWDMFSGRGSISIEAQRLGLKVHSSDLNPVAVTIQKALLQYPQRCRGFPPVNPESRETLLGGTRRKNLGIEGLVEDLRYYGRWIRDEAEKQIGHLYPKAILPDGSEATVAAWLWVRTVASPNPAAKGCHVPLVRSFALSSKSGRRTWVEPIVDRLTRSYQFVVRSGTDPQPNGTVTRRGGQCVLTETPISLAHVRAEGKAGRIGHRLMAVVADTAGRRIFVGPTRDMEATAETAKPQWYPNTDLPVRALSFSVQPYGMTKHAHLFTDRQLTALGTFADLIKEVREQVKSDYLQAIRRDSSSADNSELYADAIVTYLACALSRMTDYHCALATWNPTNENIGHLFQRQAIPMIWDYAEANPLQGKLDFTVATGWVASSLKSVAAEQEAAVVFQHDATTASDDQALSEVMAISTDPPYYNNIGYADLSDFFYVWLRRILAIIDPPLFRTVLTPKSAELIASPYRHNNSAEAAQKHFKEGFVSTFKKLHRCTESTIPMTVYYAFKQSETETNDVGDGATASTGWETMLEGLVNSGFVITGTWPVRTTKKARSVARNTNALASAIVIVCRKRNTTAAATSRREFINGLRRELPVAIKTLQRTNIAPVDLAQAAIGPGIAVFSRYAQVLEADGTAMTIRQALISINRVLDETLAEAEEDFDAETRFCVAWFEQYGTAERAYGEAEVLFTAKNTSFAALEKAEVVVGGTGRIRLRRRDELDWNWNPVTDTRLVDWKCVQHLVRAMTAETGGGVVEAARHAAAMGPSRAANARALAYRLFTVAERKGWTTEALACNILVSSWPQILDEMSRQPQGELVL